MPTVAAYKVISDAPVTFGPGAATSDHHFQFEGPSGVDGGSQCILAFRVNPFRVVTLRVRLNQTVLMTQTFDTEPQRSWHEVFSPRALQAGGNELVMSTPAEAGIDQQATLTVSDVVIFFSTTIA
jgi:hypothetical protein